MRRAAVFILVAASCILAVLAAAGCLGSLPWFPPSGQNQTGGNLSVYFLDVGQGDSALVLFNNRTILVDAGETDMGDRVVSDLRTLGVKRIDLLVATHPHSDHIGGMQAVLAAFPVGQVLDSGMPHTSGIYGNFLDTVSARGIPYTVAARGRTVDLDPALRILVLSPPEGKIGDDLNTNSVVLRISYGTTNLLMTGDAGDAAEEAMEKSGYPLDARVLKVGHHGSMYSSSPAFIARVQPEIAVISVGKGNEYGHPHNQTLATLSNAGAAIYRTDRDGTVLVTCNGITCSAITAREEGTAMPVLRPAALTSVTPAPSVTLNISLPALPENVSLPLPEIPGNVTIPVPSVTIPPVQIGNASGVYLSAVQFDAPGDDRQNLNGEWVRIANRGDAPVLIAGWTISDRSNITAFTFPAVLLMPGSPVTVYTGSGQMNDTALFMGRTEPLWGNSGDAAFLRDGAGTVVDSVQEGA